MSSLSRILKSVDEFFDFGVSSGKRIVDDNVEKILELDPSLFDHVWVFISFAPKVSLGELWQFQLK